MKKKTTFKSLGRWLIIVYLSLVIEQFCFVSSSELALLPGEKHLGVGFFLVNVFILPYLQLTLTLYGGTFVSCAMLAFALSSYSLRLKMPWSTIAITSGAAALVLAVIWDIEKFHLDSKQFWLIMVGHMLAVGFVSLLGIHSDRILDRVTGNTGVTNEE